MKKSFLVAAALLVASAAGAQTTIGASGGNAIAPFGKPNTQTYGQSFTALLNGDTQLDAFSFWMTPHSDLNFRAYVFAWDADANRAVGNALFESGVMPAPISGSGFQEVAVSTGGVSLTGGAMYVAFLSTSGVASGSGVTARWEINNGAGTTYDGGGFVFINNGDDVSQWTDGSWHESTGDMRFEMQFSAGQVSAVPEPATVALSATGLLALGGLGAFRRRRAALQG